MLDEEIWMGDQMENTVVKPNKILSYGITIQENPFSIVPMFISTEDHEFSLPLASKFTVLGVDTRTPTDE